mmetsp:Transcript_34695/g.73129  ORF Transcript_34695/g.73129 Transcript_34695/m.73129 type:complete len:96 (-) Transcript_34695:2747-3034(-)
MEIIVPRTSPVFLTFSAESGDARASRLTTGVPVITPGDDAIFSWNPTADLLVGVFMNGVDAAVVENDEFSLPSLLCNEEFLLFNPERGGATTSSD